MTDTATLIPDSRVRDDSAEPTYAGLTAVAWVRLALIIVPFVVLFRYNLVRLWLKTNPFYGESNWAHACVVPLISIYYLYVNREALQRARVTPSWWGVPIILGGITLFGYGIWPGQNDFFKDVGMVFTLFGIVATIAGWEVMKTAWFPILFLLCAIPWPGLMYQKIAGPLQALAAKASVMALRATGVNAQNHGTKIIIDGAKTLNVAEACAGLRSLMTFITIGGAMAFLSNRALWQKLVITASAIPVAIACNVMRVSGQGLLHKHVSENISESFFHQFVGMVMLIPGFFLILLVGWILDRVFIEEADAKRLLAAAAARKRGGVKVAAKVATATKSAAAAAPAPLPKPQVAIAVAPSAHAAPAAKPAAVKAPAGGDLAEATKRLSQSQARPVKAVSPATPAARPATAAPKPVPAPAAAAAAPAAKPVAPATKPAAPAVKAAMKTPRQHIIIPRSPAAGASNKPQAPQPAPAREEP